MKTFTSEMFECVFCGFSSPVTVRTEPDNVQHALAATRCPHCRQRFARGPVFAAFAAVGVGIATVFLAFAMLLRVAVAFHHRTPLSAWAGNWMFAAALVAGAIAFVVSFVQGWRALGHVRFARAPALPIAIANFAGRAKHMH
jgi:hypothetical protein